jgi:hypothetical protein
MTRAVPRPIQRQVLGLGAANLPKPYLSAVAYGKDSYMPPECGFGKVPVILDF